MSDQFLKKIRKAKWIKGYCCFWDDGPIKKWAKRCRKNKQARRVLQKHTNQEIKEET